MINAEYGPVIAGAAASCIFAAQSALFRRLGTENKKDLSSLRSELDGKLSECSLRMTHLERRIEQTAKEALVGTEWASGSLTGRPVRARALRALRSGAAPDSVAKDMGLAVAEVRLLAKVGSLLAPRVR